MQTAQSRTRPQREVQRAQILLRYAQGQKITAISRALRVSRVAVYKWVDRALALGAEAALSDQFHRPREPVITEQAKAWVASLACTKPKDHGYAAEVWSHRQLAKQVRENALAQGHPSLSRAAKATVQRILKSQTLQPHKVKYYLERRDPEFDEKMREVLLVYQEVDLQNKIAPADPAAPPAVVTVSVDEKPGLQAIANTAVFNPGSGTALYEESHGQVALTRFAQAHPQFWAVDRNGQSRSSRLSFAFAEVRQHKLDLVKEMMGYGFQDLLLDFVRQLPRDSPAHPRLL